MKNSNTSRYKKNLTVDGRNVYSYNTLVAIIDFEFQVVRRLGYWSQTTSKHINYVASTFNFPVVY